MRLKLRHNDGERLDEAFRVARAGDTIELGEGEFYTRGPWDFESQGHCQLRDGVSLIGKGPELTSIVLSDPQLSSDGTTNRPDLEGLWCGHYGATSVFPEISGFTLDVSAVERTNPVWPNGYEAKSVGGLVVHGKARIYNVNVVGVRGDYAAGLEAFGIRLGNPAYTQRAGGSHLVACNVFGSPNCGYVTAFMIGYTPKGYKAVIEETNVVGCSAIADKTGHVAISANYETSITAFTSAGFKHGFYVDTGDARNVEITGSNMACSYAGARIVLKGENCANGITIRRCLFDLDDIVKPVIGIAIERDTGGITGNSRVDMITFEDVKFSSIMERMVAVSINHPNLSRVNLIKCDFPEDAVQNLVDVSKSRVMMNGMPASLPAYSELS